MPLPVDHLLYATTELAEGMDEIEALLGVRPVVGGRHPGFGTHNALLSLGPSVYLEVIARDPDLEVPPQGVLADVPSGTPGHLMTWVLRATDITAAARDARVAGVDLGDVEAGQRQNPSGEWVRWRLTDPYAERLGGALPFLIDWGDTPHPSGVAPSGGKFGSLRIEHPDPDSIRAALDVLDSDVDVCGGDRFCLVAMIETSRGLVELR